MTVLWWDRDVADHGSLRFLNTSLSIESAQRDLFEHIEVFYDRKRRLSLLGDISPVGYESAPTNPN